jgi:hypothetical protein
MGHVRSAGSGKGSRLGAGARDVHVVLVETGRRVSGGKPFRMRLRKWGEPD